MLKVTLRTPAKLNLALEVVDLLENGYHSVDMIMQSISLYDRVEVMKSRGYTLRCPGSRIGTGDKNTATKAARAFFYETGLLAGAEITLHKKIPTRAGLGGGSADAAAVLVGLNALYGARLSTEELCAIGAGVGADVPFAILGGTARAEGIGEKLTPLPPLAGCHFVVAMPRGVGVSTPEAYARYDQTGSPTHPDVAAAARALAAQNLAALLPHMQNALQEANLGEAGRAILAALRGAGAAAAMMTGSGAAVFGLFYTEAAARQAAEALAPFGAQVFVARPESAGPVVEREQ